MVCADSKYQIQTEKNPENRHCNFVYKHKTICSLLIIKFFYLQFKCDILNFDIELN